MRNFIKFIFVFILISVFLTVLNNIYSIFTGILLQTNSWSGEVGVYHKRSVTKSNIKKVYKQENFSNTNEEEQNFSEQVRNNRKYINQRFPENYIERVLSYGKLKRWNPETFPLTVYIENNPQLPEYYYSEVKKAFQQWQKDTENFVRFVYTNNKQSANIRCEFKNFADLKNNSPGGMSLGVTQIKTKKGVLKYSQIDLAITDSKGKYFNSKHLYSTILHEIGHSLGLSGHSVNKKDIMYPVNYSNSGLSKGDINTLKLLYSIVPDVSNKNYTEEQKRKFITTEDILGDYDTRINIEISKTNDDINTEISSSSPSKFVKLGYLNYKKKNYNEAIKNYEKAISLTNSNDKKAVAGIYIDISDCYENLKNYEKALNYVKLANEIFPQDEYIVIQASIYKKMNDNESAKKILINLINKNPKVYNAYIELAEIYQDENNQNALRDLYIKGKQYFPNNPPLKIITN